VVQYDLCFTEINIELCVFSPRKRFVLQKICACHKLIEVSGYNRSYQTVGRAPRGVGTVGPLRGRELFV
jgi:hypothetical protein